MSAAGATDSVLLVGRYLVDRRYDGAGRRVRGLTGVDGFGFKSVVLAQAASLRREMPEKVLA